MNSDASELNMRASIVISLLFGNLSIALPVSATDREMSDADFVYYAAVLRSSAETRTRFIESCPTSVLETLTDSQKDDMAARTNMPIKQAANEACERVLRGIISGKLTYGPFSEWMRSPDGKLFSLPGFE
jgi:hypothetical protein